MSAEEAPGGCLAWEAAGGSDIGRVRARNEDRYSIDTENGIFIVADGLGGHPCGDRAIEIAVQVTHERLRGFLQSAELQKAPPRGTGVTRATGSYRAAVKRALSEAIQAANQEILREALHDPGCFRMGCALLAAVVRCDELFIGTAGDVRAYLVRDGGIERLTQDHTVAANLVRSGVLSEAAARTSYLRNQLTRAVGLEDELAVDTYAVPLKPDDQVLVCSDGLWEPVSDERMRDEVMHAKTPGDAVRTLISLANDLSGSDNITAVVVRVAASSDAGLL